MKPLRSRFMTAKTQRREAQKQQSNNNAGAIWRLIGVKMMLYYLHNLSDLFSPLRVFRYITFRAMLAAGTAFVLSLIFGPWLIRALRKSGVRELNVDSRIGSLDRAGKVGTPTMGGLLILSATLVSAVLWTVPFNIYVLLAASTFAAMGALGFFDDWLKLRRGRGLSSRSKLLGQAGWVAIFVLVLMSDPERWARTQQLMIPFLKDPLILSMEVVGTIGFLGVILIGSANAVNLTDGLDGLAIGCATPAVGAYLVMAYVAGHFAFAEYLQIPFVKGAGELAVFCGALLGACLGFLWFNCHPAQIFMGDTGSLAIGGALAAVAILIKQELVLILVGGVFVLEALSVVMQVGTFKYTRIRFGKGQRILHRSPLHHHFEEVEKFRAQEGGQPAPSAENRITIRFWIVSILFALLGLVSLKIR